MFKPLSRGEVVFDLIDEIGMDGQNSKTFRAHDHHLDAEIVIKRMTKGSLSSPTEFFRESRILYKSSHPNVCEVHYACFDADYIYIAMPFYRRGSLKNWMTKENLTVREIAVVATQVASALHNIHSKGLIHFDVKPDNILISNRGEAIVSDFGQASHINIFGKAKPNAFYTKGVAPEITVTNVFDHRFDIDQLGLTLYRMCNGIDFFNNQFAAFLDAKGEVDQARLAAALAAGTFPDRSIFPAHIPTNMRSMIKTCLEVDPARRFPTAIAASNALATLSTEFMDWRYSAAGGKETWIRNEGGTLCELVRYADGRCECHRTSAAGNRRRDNQGFIDNASDTKLRGVLKQL